MAGDNEEKKEGKYIYCIIETDEEMEFGPTGIGDRADKVYTFGYDGVAAVISNSPVIKYPINRKNTIAHQKVMEEVMKSYTILPVRFCTIAEDKDGRTCLERIRQKVLIERRQEFKDLMAWIGDKAELGIKAIWPDMKENFSEILHDRTQIKVLKEKIEKIQIANPSKATHRERVRLGEMVRNALNAKREKHKNVIVGVLKRFSVDTRINKDFGDNMIVNAAFLVAEKESEHFDRALNRMSAELGEEKVKFKYVGPVPPCNFVEIVITWE